MKKFKPRRWIVPNLLTEGVMLLAGKPKCGKSWLALNTAVAVSTGKLLLGTIKTESIGVLYLALEDSERRIKERLTKMLPPGSWPTNVYLVVAGGMNPMDKGGREDLKEWLADHPEVKLVIIDTLGRIKSSRKRNQEAYDHDTGIGDELQKIAFKYHLCILIVHHTRKMRGDDIIDEVSGTYGLTGAVDGIMLLDRKNRVKFDAKLFATGRDIEDLAFALAFDKDCGTWVEVDPTREKELSSHRQEIKDTILKAGRPMSPKEVALALGKNYNNVKFLMWEMSNKKQLLSNSGHYSIY